MTKPKSAKTKTAAATIARLTVIAAGLALATPSRAQIVAIWPSNYSHTVTVQNNLGRLWPAWHTATRDSVVLGARVLTVAHVVYLDSPYVGTKIGAPRLFEDRFVYRQIGAATYRPLGGESIVWFTPQVGGGWIARTNLIMPELLEDVYWQPALVGRYVESDSRLHRTITTGSPLICWGQNRARSVPYLVTYSCTGTTSFNYDVRFEPDQVRSFSLDLDRANASLNFVSVDWFTFGMDEAGEQPLAH